jgi:MFS family permease
VTAVPAVRSESQSTTTHPKAPTRTQSPFAPLRSPSYRAYLSGQALSSIGTWMQGIAQDWLVLQLTHSSTAVGLTLAFQFVPMLLFGVYGGLLADRFPKRRILFATQSVNITLAAALAALTVTGAIRVEYVYLFAVIGGCVFAVDAPTRQAFVTEVVPQGLLRGAVSLTAATFQATRLVGPALAGVVGTFGLNYPVVLSAMATRTFHGDAGTYGLFNIAVAIGSMGGALAAGSWRHTRLRLIVAAGVAFGVLQALAATAPSVPTFFALLVALGVSSLGFQSMANSSVQLWVDPDFRGRVMGLYMLVFVGGTTIGSPIVGALTNTFGPRFGMAFCGVVPAVAAVVVGLLNVPAGRVAPSPDPATPAAH